ncbi:hypothetical protein Ancab_012387 [Ancistrocladus abbreviatus]
MKQITESEPEHSESWHTSDLCPSGTIPIRRQLNTLSLKRRLNNSFAGTAFDPEGHMLAVGIAYPRVAPATGAQGLYSVWNLKVQQGDYSVAVLSLIGAFDWIEAGWIAIPSTTQTSSIPCTITIPYPIVEDPFPFPYELLPKHSTIALPQLIGVSNFVKWFSIVPMGFKHGRVHTERGCSTRGLGEGGWGFIIYKNVLGGGGGGGRERKKKSHKNRGSLVWEEGRGRGRGGQGWGGARLGREVGEVWPVRRGSGEVGGGREIREGWVRDKSGGAGSGPEMKGECGP